MTKIIVIIILITIVAYIVKQAFNLGKLSSEKKEEVKYTENLDKIIADLKAEINRVENASPEEIAKHEAKISDLKSELERVQKLKNTFNN
jgi:vacuolar-type H+-ATPase subunit I/STV1